ncbi:hypothetical protein BURKHO8Y_140361 [Burkholderia sp. 8Y]|nr:hypothetical protein BURKHO8Y_140361 [Burkholderia sp. 8Y]
MRGASSGTVKGLYGNAVDNEWNGYGWKA